MSSACTIHHKLCAVHKVQILSDHGMGNTTLALHVSNNSNNNNKNKNELGGVDHALIEASPQCSHYVMGSKQASRVWLQGR